MVKRRMGKKAKRLHRRPSRPTARLRLELLEDRLAPYAYTWTGAGGDGIWSDAQNWTTNAPGNPSTPGATDTAYFTQAAPNSIVNTTRAVGALVIGGSLGNWNGILTINAGVTLLVGGSAPSQLSDISQIVGPGTFTTGQPAVFNWNNGAIGPAATNFEGTTNISTSTRVTIRGPITNTGTLNISQAEVFMSTPTQLRNAGVWNLYANAVLLPESSTLAASVLNAGTMEKIGGGSAFIEVPFTTSGALIVLGLNELHQSNELHFTGPTSPTETGFTVSLADNAILDVSATPGFVINGGRFITGSATIRGDVINNRGAFDAGTLTTIIAPGGFVTGGSGYGSVYIAGSYKQGPLGLIQFNVLIDAKGLVVTNSSMQVADLLQCAGALIVDTKGPPGVIPRIGDRADLIRWLTISGDFNVGTLIETGPYTPLVHWVHNTVDPPLHIYEVILVASGPNHGTGDGGGGAAGGGGGGGGVGTANTGMNQPLTIDVLAGLNGPVSLSSVSEGGAGSTQIVTVGNRTEVLYTPNPGFVGQDLFTYTTFDGVSTTTNDEFVNVATLLINPALTISSIGTSAGSGGGGTNVTITGSGFAAGDGVVFGGVPSQRVTVNSATSITAVSPTHSPGPFDIQVTNSSGISPPVAADLFTFNAAPPVPAVTSLTTNSGPGGTTVLINGSGFTGALLVSFGTVQVQASNFTVNNDGLITINSPLALAAGPVDVVVTTPGGSSATSPADVFTYNATSPTLSAVSSNGGPTAGGNIVTITGTNFSGTPVVLFGNLPARSVHVLSSTSLTAVAPPQAAGTVGITVTTPGGSVSLSAAYTYTGAAAPTVTGVTPNSGPAAGSISVTIIGTNFGGANGVFFGGAAALSYQVTSVNAIQATAPPGAGTVDITVSTPNGTSATSTSDRFSYPAPTAPTIAGLNVSSGPTGGGTSISITGTGFTPQMTVSFGSVTIPASAVKYFLSTQIIVVSPAEQAGTVDIIAQTQYGTSAPVSADRFTFVAPSAPPSISSVGPTSCPAGGGTLVYIQGSGFTGASQVDFGTTPASFFRVISDGSITATAPAGVTGTVNITVTTPVGVSGIVSADQFTFNSASAPTVGGMLPASGPTAGGTVVTVFGTHFTGATAVYFGGVLATAFQVLLDGDLVATAPVHAPGTVDVTIVGPGGTSATSSADHYTYNVGSVPTVASVTASSDSTLGGSSIAIIGTNFGDATQVYFGTVPATSITIYSSTALVVVNPPHAAGTVDVTVVNYAGASTISSADHFTYSNLAGPAPAVFSLSQNSSSTAGGPTISITGSNFTGATSVSFGATAANFTVVSSSQINAVVPAASAGSYDVTVTTPNGTSATSSVDQFTYLSTPAPAVTNVSPATGTSAGGTSVTITGTNFTNVAGVTFGGVASSSFTVNSSTQITATAPPQGAGLVDITVTTPSGTSAAVSADHFTYTLAAAPAVTGLSPASGTTAGGGSVTITGTGFTAATGVDFGNVPAASFTVNSDTQIVAIAPPGPAGSFPVTVTTPSGTSALVTADVFTVTLAAAPTVTNLSTTTDSTAGGTTVTITGTAFTGARSVMFGTVPANSFQVSSDTQITAVSPPNAVGTVSVTVVTPSGTSAASSASQYTYSAGTAPAVTSLNQSGGPTGGGTQVTISGSGFNGVTAVLFGTTPADFSVSGTQLLATSPAHLAGTVDVTVTTTGGTSATSTSDQFTYNGVVPAITSISGNTGLVPGGAAVAILGSGFTGASAVDFGNVSARAFVVISDDVIMATQPRLSPGTCDITVTTANGTSAKSSADQFTTSVPNAPAITSLTAGSASTAGGAMLIINGTNFGTVSAVLFGAAVTSTFVVNSNSMITLVEPPNTPGYVYVSVVTAGGTSVPVNAALFTYTQAGAPTVTSLGPTSGSTAVGTLVTVTGTNFVGVTSVAFGTTLAASFTVLSPTEILAVTPSLPAGTDSVVVTTGTGNSATSAVSQFTFTAAATPAVTGVSPNTGSTAGGTFVTITGSGFTTATAVKFGATAAAAFTVLSDTQIMATEPALATGTVDVTVTTTAGTSSTSSADQFSATAATVPTVTAITPTSGLAAGGTVVTISGSNFTGATGVSFGSVAASSFRVNSDGSITATAPAGTAGTKDITITTFGGTSATSSADQFTYSAVSVPTVTGLSTTSGTTAGGTVVIITGTGFTSATQVKFGSVTAPLYAINSDTQITAVVPAEAAGTVHTMVTNYTGTSATGSGDQFSYSNASVATVTSISTNNGPLGGGTIVTITGTNFTGATAVKFGSTAATSFTIYSATAIVAVDPSESAATIDITVTTYSGTSATSSADQFSYLTTPTITSASPNQGGIGGGTNVTLTGTSFLGVTGVSFGGVAATSFTINSNTSITATSPAGSAGAVSITVTNAYGTSGGYTFTYMTAPTITSLNPTSGSPLGGTVVTISGTSFLGATSVSFGGLSASFTVNSNTSITATTPAHSAATVSVTVTNAYGTSNSVSYTYKTSGVGGGHQLILDTPSLPAIPPQPLTMREIEALLPQAIGEWQRAGAGPVEVQMLKEARFEITDMPVHDLGFAYAPVPGPKGHPALILLDRYAQGFGWFVDPHSKGTVAFPLRGGPTEWYATPGSPAFGHVDLLTVLAHELGHVIGFWDVDPILYPGNIEDMTIDPGVRRMPRSIQPVTGSVSSLVPPVAPNTHSSHGMRPSKAKPADLLSLELLSAIDGLISPRDLLRSERRTDRSNDTAQESNAAYTLPGLVGLERIQNVGSRDDVSFNADKSRAGTQESSDWLFMIADWRHASESWADDLSFAMRLRNPK